MKRVFVGNCSAAMALGCLLVLLTAPCSVYAQERAQFEIEAGIGYLGGVGESGGIAFAAVNAGLTFWFHRSVGVAGTVVYGPGGGPSDVTTSGVSEKDKNVRLVNVTFRYRRALGESTDLNLGVGVGFGSHELPFDDTYALAGYAFEALLARRLSSAFGIKGGLSIDTIGADGLIIRPSISGTVSF